MTDHPEATLKDVAKALRPLTMLPNAPALTRETAAIWAELLRRKRVTVSELAEACVMTLETATFWPAPAEVLRCVDKVRRASYAANQRSEFQARLAEGRARRAGRIEPPEIPALPVSRDSLPLGDVDEGPRTGRSRRALR